MAFGRSANTKKGTSDSDPGNKRDNPFLDTKNGIRIFRLPAGSEEVRVKRHWIAKNEDGTWEPKFGYNPNDKRRAVPVTVAVWNVEDGRWIGADTYWRNNPIDVFVSTLDETDRTGKYAQDVFFLNVLDLTPIRVDSEGNEYYPDENMKYPAAVKDAAKQISGRMKILSGSSGEPDGKSLYANLLRTAKGALNDDGEVLSIYDYEIRLITSGKGKETNRSFTMGTVRPMPEEYANLPVYDLMAMCKPWPNEAIAALFEGADYAEVVKEHGIVLYPPLIASDEALF